MSRVRFACTGRGSHGRADLGIIAAHDLEWAEAEAARPSAGNALRLTRILDVSVDRTRASRVARARRQGRENSAAASSAELRALPGGHVVAVFACPRCRGVEMRYDALQRFVALGMDYPTLGPVDVSLYAVAGEAYLRHIEQAAAAAARSLAGRDGDHGS